MKVWRGAGTDRVSGASERKGESLIFAWSLGVLIEDCGLVYMSSQGSRNQLEQRWGLRCYSLEPRVLASRCLALVVWNIHMMVSSGHSYLVLPWILSSLKKSLTAYLLKEDIICIMRHV